MRFAAPLRNAPTAHARARRMAVPTLVLMNSWRESVLEIQSRASHTTRALRAGTCIKWAAPRGPREHPFNSFSWRYGFRRKLVTRTSTKKVAAMHVAMKGRVGIITEYLNTRNSNKAPEARNSRRNQRHRVRSRQGSLLV